MPPCPVGLVSGAEDVVVGVETTSHYDTFLLHQRKELGEIQVAFGAAVDIVFCHLCPVEVELDSLGLSTLTAVDRSFNRFVGDGAPD